MLHLSTENGLSGKLVIKSQRTYVEVKIAQPEDCAFFLAVKKNNKLIEIYQLNSIGDGVFCTAVPYCKEMDDISSTYSACVVMSHGGESAESNAIDVLFNREKILCEKTESTMLEIISIKKQLADLSRQIELGFSSRVPRAIPDFDKQMCRKGMVLTAISDEGHVAFVYPFADVLNEINGKHPVMRKLELTAADIKLDGETSTVDAILKAVRQNQIDESKMLKDISDTLSKLTTKVAKLEATLVDFTNNQ